MFYNIGLSSLLAYHVWSQNTSTTTKYIILSSAVRGIQVQTLAGEEHLQIILFLNWQNIDVQIYNFYTDDIEGLIPVTTSEFQFRILFKH